MAKPPLNPLRESRVIALGALLFVVVAAVYVPSLSNGFVNVDDELYVTSNAHVQTGLRWENLRLAFSNLGAGFWHPLTWLSLMLDCQMFGLHATGHHLTALLLHAANTFLVFLLLRRLTGATWRSAFVAGLFGLHPLHVESVAWVSERKDVLSTLFWMLAMLAYVRYAEQSSGGTPKCEVRSPEPEDRGPEDSKVQGSGFVPLQLCSVSDAPSSFYYGLSLLLFVCGLMCKPTLVTMPFLLLLLDWWPLRRFTPPTLDAQPPSSRRVLLEKVPFLLLAGLAGLATIYAEKAIDALPSSSEFSFRYRLWNAVHSGAVYLVQTIWPRGLTVYYPCPKTLSAWAVGGAGLLLLAASVVCWRARRRRPYLVFGWAWYGLTLLPVIGLIQVGAFAHADRYTYVPLIGIFMILAWGLGELAERRVRLRHPLVAVAILCLAACALLTSRQLLYWRNSEALLRHALNFTKANSIAHDHLGLYLWEKGRTAEAVEQFQESLAIRPAFLPLRSLGLALASQGKLTEAIPYCEAALRLQPRDLVLRKGLAAALAQTGRPDEAITHYLTVLGTDPGDVEARNNLGITLAMQQRWDKAIEQFRYVLTAQPGDAGTHANLAYALASQHKLSEAIEEFRQVLLLNPSDPEAHQDLGSALAEQGKLDEAVKEFTEGLRLSPDSPVLHYHLGLALERQARREEASAQFTEALRLKPDYPEARRQLDSLRASPQR